MDLNTALSYINTNGWGLFIIGLGTFFLLYVLLIPWNRKWKCARCGEEFSSENEAKGHQTVHGEHKVAPMPDN